jgi:DNA-binding protein HU-beta
MAKAMSKSAIMAHFAEKFGMKRKEVAAIFDELCSLAYREAKNQFTIPGIGKLVMVDRAARMGRNPATGEAIQIPAKTVVKFRVAKAAKDAIIARR